VKNTCKMRLKRPFQMCILYLLIVQQLCTIVLCFLTCMSCSLCLQGLVRNPMICDIYIYIYIYIYMDISRAPGFCKRYACVVLSSRLLTQSPIQSHPADSSVRNGHQFCFKFFQGRPWRYPLKRILHWVVVGWGWCTPLQLGLHSTFSWHRELVF